jgi:hypothetical protein
MRPLRAKRALITRALYLYEFKVIEKISAMIKEQGLDSLQSTLDLLWEHFAPRYKTRRPKPELRFGPGVRHGSFRLSYTMDTAAGQVIELAPQGRNLYVLAHELAHALGPEQHGVKFSKVYHDILSHEIFYHAMNSKLGQQFLEYLRTEHPRYVRRVYRSR